MPVSSNTSAPYAPASAILSVIDRFRNRGMQAPFTEDVLVRAGVSESLIPRTLQTLRVLDLIDESGEPTETLELIRRSPEAEFKDSLAAWIRNAYAAVLAFVEPTDSEIAIRDAFRNYNPVGQHPRMVALFMGLCSAAGMRADDQIKESRPRPQARKSALPLALAAQRRATAQKPRSIEPRDTSIPPLLGGLLESLPKASGSWTKAERDKFVQTFGAVIDFCYTIKEEGEVE